MEIFTISNITNPESITQPRINNYTTKKLSIKFDDNNLIFVSPKYPCFKFDAMITEAVTDDGDTNKIIKGTKVEAMKVVLNNSGI